VIRFFFFCNGSYNFLHFPHKEYGIKTFYDKFIANLEKSFGIDEGSLVNEVSHLKEMQEIVNQVVDKIKVHISKEMTTMKLNLNPEHLGKVELEVTSKSGVLTADFVVENETAKEALEKGLPALIEKFHEQGLKVEAIEVRIADYDFTNQENERNRAGNQGNEDKKKKRNGKISLDEVSSQQEVVQEEHKIMSNHGIDYTA
jgi:flagellar hook-length control protein FliK